MYRQTPKLHFRWGVYALCAIPARAKEGMRRKLLASPSEESAQSSITALALMVLQIQKTLSDKKFLIFLPALLQKLVGEIFF